MFTTRMRTHPMATNVGGTDLTFWGVLVEEGYASGDLRRVMKGGSE